MGLHPQAITSFLLTIFELLGRNYKVIISTHSSTILTTIWFINEIKKCGRNEKDLATLFNVKLDQQLKKVFNGLIGDKKVKTYYFDYKTEKRESVISDISSLDPFSENNDISDWGGLTSLETKASEIFSHLDKGNE
jgi:hypothetical protein